ncbi:MAG: hypothetical protein JXB18_01430 [Sedimentisphaerales bacterium]|nr:hypothetical protein [Sedimentisphaerales bacterium]
MAKSSPFEQVHLQMGAQMGDYYGWRLPIRYSTLEAEKHALDTHCAAFDLCGFGRISVKGRDAEVVLAEAGLTNLPDYSSQQWIWAGSETEKAHRIAALRNEYIVISTPGNSLFTAVGDIIQKQKRDATVADLSEKTAFLGLYGPGAFESVGKLLPFEIDELTVGSAMPVSFFMMNFILLRGSWLNGDGLELFCPASAAGLVGGSIAKYRQKYNITPAGMECLMTAMVTGK